jgi:ribose transport system substrate-binding protein
MKKNIFFIIFCSMIVILILFGCENSSRNSFNNVSPKNNDKKQTYVAIISKGWQHQFWQSVKMGADKAANDYNVKITFEGPEGDSSISKQIEMIDSALGRKPAILVLAACDNKTAIPEIEKAKALNIPVIMFDSGIESDIPITTVATDNAAAASEAADKLAEAIGKEGEVAVICHDSVSITGISRRDGFINEVNKKYPNIKIVDIQYGGGDHEISKKVSNEIIIKYPNIKGVFATNEGSTFGLINAVIEQDKVGNIKIVGFDAGKLQKDSVRNGVMLGAITQNPVEMGYKAVEAAYNVSVGNVISKQIYSGYKWYDKSNVDNEDMQSLLYD